MWNFYPDILYNAAFFARTPWKKRFCILMGPSSQKGRSQEKLMKWWIWKFLYFYLCYGNWENLISPLIKPKQSLKCDTGVNGVNPAEHEAVFLLCCFLISLLYEHYKTVQKQTKFVNGARALV